jgi:asparagine synthase (glutamine-hydrolysing)
MAPEPADVSRAFSVLDPAFEVAIGPWREAPAPLTLLFSGGVDSGLLAWELRGTPAIELVTIGVAGATDLAAAQRSAELLGLRVRTVEVGEVEIVAASHRWSAVLDGVSPVHRSVLIAFAVALEHSKPGPVLCGQGADELFLGYAHFRELGSRDAAARSEVDLRTLLEADGPRLDRIGSDSGRSVVSPYLAPEFIAAARSLSIEERMPRGLPKGLFRRWAIHRGLPAEIADRPKRALQYGSGVARLLSRTESATSPEGAATRRRTAIYPGPGPPA